MDFRLALAAASCWLGTAAAVIGLPKFGWIGLTPLAVVALVATIKWRQIGLVLALFVSLGVVLAAVRVLPAHSGPLAKAALTHEFVRLNVLAVGDIHYISQRNALDWTSKDAAWFSAATRDARFGDQAVQVWAQTTPAFAPGAVLQVAGRLSPGNRGFAARLQAEDIALVRAAPIYQDIATRIRTALSQAVKSGPSRAAALAPGLVLGDTSSVDEQLRSEMRLAGLTHLLAVSGANLSIFLGVVFWLTRRMRLSIRALCAALAMVAFVVLVRPEPSVMRATAMGAIGILAMLSGRAKAAIPALALGVLLLLVIDPMLAVSAGFALSVFATGGLLLWATGLARLLDRRWRWPKWAASALGLTIAAQLAVLPVQISIGAPISLAALPANVLAAPLAAWVGVAGLATALVAVLWLPAGQVLAWLILPPAQAIGGIAEFASRLPGAVLQIPGGLLGVGLASVILGWVTLLWRQFRYWPTSQRAGAGSISLALVVLLLLPPRLQSWPPPDWQVAVCDVGQGDMAILRVGERSAIVVDTGPTSEVAKRCLQTFGIAEVPLLLLTHFHADHVGGLVGVLSSARVHRALTTSLDLPLAPSQWAKAQLGLHRVSTAIVQIPSAAQVGQWRLQFIWPIGAQEEPNDSSIIAIARTVDTCILLTGDAGEIPQSVLIAHGLIPQCANVKVPHHGSRYTDTRLPGTVSAQSALISVGRDNDYGHPATSTLLDWQLTGASVFRTDQAGDLAILGRGEVVTRRTYGWVSLVRGIVASWGN